MEYTTAAALAPKLKLRSLDLLHLAYASLISRLEFSISSFVTGDETILGKTDEIPEISQHHSNTSRRCDSNLIAENQNTQITNDTIGDDSRKEKGEFGLDYVSLLMGLSLL
jgi:hypothetical protein